MTEYGVSYNSSNTNNSSQSSGRKSNMHMQNKQTAEVEQNAYFDTEVGTNYECSLVERPIHS